MGDGRDKTAKVGREQIMQDLRCKAFSAGMFFKKGLEPGVPSLEGSFKYPGNV